jgi:hypothetical protein
MTNTQNDGQNSAILTPYGAAKLVNARLTEEGLPTIPPQMMYNYTTARVRAGKAPFVTWDEENGVDREALATWTDKYVAKKLAATQA